MLDPAVQLTRRGGGENETFMRTWAQIGKQLAGPGVANELFRGSATAMKALRDQFEQQQRELMIGEQMPPAGLYARWMLGGQYGAGDLLGNIANRATTMQPGMPMPDFLRAPGAFTTAETMRHFAGEFGARARGGIAGSQANEAAKGSIFGLLGGGAALTTRNRFLSGDPNMVLEAIGPLKDGMAQATEEMYNAMKEIRKKVAPEFDLMLEDVKKASKMYSFQLFEDMHLMGLDLNERLARMQYGPQAAEERMQMGKQNYGLHLLDLLEDSEKKLGLGQPMQMAGAALYGSKEAISAIANQQMMDRNELKDPLERLNDLQRTNNEMAAVRNDLARRMAAAMEEFLKQMQPAEIPKGGQ